jgi:hypothetical protein
MKSDSLTHSSRILTLARYGNKLPGTEPPLMDIQVRKYIFSPSCSPGNNSSYSYEQASK